MHRTLNFHHILLYCVGNTIGAGIFALTGVAAKSAGPSLFISFILSGTIAMLTALVFCELSSRLPSTGSAYSYIYSIYGELPAWIVGWNMNLRYGGSAAALSRAWTSYFVGLLQLLGLTVPLFLYDLDVFGYSGSILTVFYILFCVWLANKG